MFGVIQVFHLFLSLMEEQMIFFYSGHTGFSMIAGLEYRRIGNKWLEYLSYFQMALNFFLLTVTRTHYFIDLACGIMIAHYIYIIVGHHVESFDNYMFARRSKFE